MAETKSLKISTDFSEYPGPRYINQGNYSGEEFYVTKLNPIFAECIQNGYNLVINLDDTAGYASSFLDEAFGELVFDFGLSLVKDFLNIESLQEPSWKDMIYNETFPQWETRRKERNVPRSSEKHHVFMCLDNGEIVKRQR